MDDLKFVCPQLIVFRTLSQAMTSGQNPAKSGP